jgi:hypothetical protein
VRKLSQRSEEGPNTKVSSHELSKLLIRISGIKTHGKNYSAGGAKFISGEKLPNQAPTQPP